MIEARVQFPAGLSGLRDLEDGPADFVDIPDANVRFGDATRRDVLAECACVLQDTRPMREPLQPVGVVVPGIMMDCLVAPAMAFEVGLMVAFEAGGAREPGAVHRRLGDAARLVPGAEWCDFSDE
jgi:hypothetical protein